MRDIHKEINRFYKLATYNKKSILSKIENEEFFNSKEKIAESFFDRISSGSSRIVYKTPDNSVIKIAKNEKGIEQNKAESNKKIKSAFINPVTDHAKNFSWIESKFCKKMTEKRFEELTNLNFKDFGKAIEYALKDVSDSDISKPKNFSKIEKEKIFKELVAAGNDFKLMPGDMSRISSYGESDSLPVLIDSGLTKKIFEKYYDDED